MERMLATAQVDATIAAVRPGAPEVRVLAESGEPIVVVPMPERSSRPAPSGRPPRSRNPRRQSGERQAAHHRSSTR
jgi:hypothetical protein